MSLRGHPFMSQREPGRVVAFCQLCRPVHGHVDTDSSDHVRRLDERANICGSWAPLTAGQGIAAVGQSEAVSTAVSAGQRGTNAGRHEVGAMLSSQETNTTQPCAHRFTSPLVSLTVSPSSTTPQPLIAASTSARLWN